MGSKECDIDRQSKLDLILNSTSEYKVIVAGAGTGKTYTFKKLLEKNGGVSDCIALTLTNNLVDDLTVELNGLAKAQTFHGLCKELLHKIKSPGIDRGFHLYPDLISIISSDYKIIFGGKCGTLKKIKESFNKAFHLLNEDDDAKLIEFFIQRGSVYNAVGFDDSVYRVLVELRKSGDIIPEYSQIVVDEYQDFNRLEVEFLKLLEGKSPTLIVGDDDQAIYDFKHATPKYLRRIVGDQEALKYEKFSLPYCSRCPSVIISSIHNIVAKAKNMELLKN